MEKGLSIFLVQQCGMALVEVEKNASDAKMNLGGSSQTVRQKLTSEYTTTSGVNKRWLQTL